jgi:hypothetical protein
MSDLWPVARGLADHLASVRGLTIVEPGNPYRRALMGGASLALRLVGIDPAPLVDRMERTSACLPLGVGNRSLVLLSDHAVSDAVTFAAVVSHEGHHDAQEDEAGHLRGAWDYLASAEVRAKRDADAYAVGIFVRYLLTGEPVEDHGALASLESGPYHLGPGEVSLCRGLLLSHLASMRAGVCPPLSTAALALAYLRAHHPAGIAAVAFRVQP